MGRVGVDRNRQWEMEGGGEIWKEMGRYVNRPKRELGGVGKEWGRWAEMERAGKRWRERDGKR